MSATADQAPTAPAPGGAVLRALAMLGAGVAIGIALQTIYTAYFGMFEPSLHRGAIIGAASATLLLLRPAGAGRRGATAALWWVVDLAMLAVLAAALWRFFAAADNLENALIDYERWEQWLGLGGVLVVLELTRRQFGWPLFAVCLLALLYCLFGQYLPSFLRHTGFPLDQTMQTLWFGLQGVFGLPTSVVLQLVLIFIVFGVVLEGTGAGAALIRIAFSLTGGSRGGPAHAAVVASAIFGTMSGSVAANVVGTGTITMPLIKQRGFSPAFAGAVEAAASTGGQIMPPVMGAAAFYMAQLTGHSLTRKIRLLGLPEEAFGTAAMKEVMALPARTVDVIPAKTYGNNQANETDIKTVGSWVGLSTHVGVDENDVYAITKTMWENIAELRAAAPWMKVIAKDTAFKFMNVPLHKGAYRYYKEAGFNIPPEIVPKD